MRRGQFVFGAARVLHPSRVCSGGIFDTLIFKPAMAKSGRYGDQEKRLIACGVLTPPVKERSSTPMREPPGNVPDDVMEQVWREEREGR